MYSHMAWRVDMSEWWAPRVSASVGYDVGGLCLVLGVARVRRCDVGVCLHLWEMLCLGWGGVGGRHFTCLWEVRTGHFRNCPQSLRGQVASVAPSVETWEGTSARQGPGEGSARRSRGQVSDWSRGRGAVRGLQQGYVSGPSGFALGHSSAVLRGCSPYYSCRH